MVWMAARRADPRRIIPFTAYALLGDDIVINDKVVAEEYYTLLEALGVSISVPKSLFSNVGALEFAKKYWIQGRDARGTRGIIERF